MKNKCKTCGHGKAEHNVLWQEGCAVSENVKPYKRCPCEKFTPEKEVDKNG